MSRNDTATVQRVVERLEPARDLLADGAGAARERLADVAEAVEPTARRVSSSVAGRASALLATLSFLPGLLSKVLGALAGVTGSLAERGRETAYRMDPPASVRRRSRLRTVLWFVGGFGAGTATGWVLHARMQEAPAPAEPPATTASSPVRPSSPGSPIDARRQDIDLR